MSTNTAKDKQQAFKINKNEPLNACCLVEYSYRVL